MDVEQLPLPRPPGSAGESRAANAIRRRLTEAGVTAHVERFRAPTSPSWVPLLGAALRLAAAALLVGGLGGPAAVLAAIAVVASIFPHAVAWVLKRVPGIGAASCNVVAHVPGAPDVVDPPLVVVAHLDAHPTAGEPLRRPHTAIAGLVGLGLLAIALASLGSDADPQGFLALLALEPAATLIWLAHQELVATEGLEPDDNASGLAALVRIGDLLGDERPSRHVWLVATGSGTAGSGGLRALFRMHRDIAKLAWVIEVDALGSAELVVTPGRRRFPRMTTPPAVLRAIAGAAIDSGDLIDIRRVPRPHSDANAATGLGVPALTLTGGQNALGPAPNPDAANAERAARIVDRLARTTL